MNRNTLPTFSWVTFISIKKFFDPGYLIGYVLPSTVLICSIVVYFINLSKNESLAVGLIIILILFIYQTFRTYMEYEISVETVIETGGFPSISWNIAFRWLTIESIKKFSDPMYLFGYVLPATLCFNSIIAYFIDLSNLKSLVVCVIVFVLLFLCQIYARYKEYEKSIAEVLETGYFYNFFEKTATFIHQRKKNKKPITFTFNDGTIKTVSTDQIIVKVILPLSLNSLSDTIEKVKKITVSGNIDNGAWVLAQKNPDNTITIYEYPRTLTAISTYLVSPKIDYGEEISIIFHKYFNTKFDKDWENVSDKIPSDIFKKINKLDE